MLAIASSNGLIGAKYRPTGIKIAIFSRKITKIVQRQERQVPQPLINYWLRVCFGPIEGISNVVFINLSCSKNLTATLSKLYVL